MLLTRHTSQKLILLFIASFAVIWTIFRASVQSITFDEAFTYLFFVAKPFRFVFSSSSNNHVLNSLLMWVTTRVFGTSSITVRLPALLGAILYVWACYLLCRGLTTRFSLQVSVLICLTYNPFILDFMAAARGYSLANGFLLVAIAIPVWHDRGGGPSLRRPVALASLALGLSFSANFAFAFVDLTVLLVIVTWAIRRRGTDDAFTILGLSVVPGLVVALLICGYPLAHWQKNDIFYGAHSLREMTQSLADASLYQLYPPFAKFGFFKFVNDALRPLLLPFLGLLCLLQLAVTALDGSWQGPGHSRWLSNTAGLIGVVGLTVTLHWLFFRFAHLLLPMTRTGIFLIPLCTLIAALIASGPAASLFSRWLRRALTGAMICLACYFLLCLRLSYFREYQWNADVKEAYSALARLNHVYGVSDVDVTGMYISALNYYRVLSEQETFSNFKWELPELSAGRSAYVMNGVENLEFIEREKLLVIYRGSFSDIVVAVNRRGPLAVIKP